MKPSTADILKVLTVCLITLPVNDYFIRPIFVHAPPPLNETAWLRACAQVESPDGKPGKAGEVGYYQISPAVMQEYLASGSKETPEVWHLHELEVAHQTFSPRRLFELWRGQDDEDYENRAMALYQEYNQ